MGSHHDSSRQRAQSWLSGPSEVVGRRHIRAPLEARFCRQGEKGLREPAMDNSSRTWFSARASSKGPGALLVLQTARLP